MCIYMYMRYDINYFVECEDTLWSSVVESIQIYTIYIEKIQLPASMFNVYVKILPPAQFFKFNSLHL